MRRAYYNQWTFHHGDAALPDVQPEEQLGVAVYNVPAKITAWTTTNENENTTAGKAKKWAKKSPRLVALLLGLFVIFLLAFTSTLIAWGVLSDGFESHKGRKGENGLDDEDTDTICVSDDCTQVAGDIVRYFDKSVDPCNDFYQFVCGKYPQEIAIPRDKDKTGTMDQMEHKVKMQLRGLFEARITKKESVSSRLVKQFYHSCMDTSALQNQGLEPLKRAVENLGGWPSGAEFGWNESTYAWEKSNAGLRSEYGVHALMIVTVDSDFRNNTKKMITIDQPDAENLNLVQWVKIAKARGKSLLHSALDSMVDLALEFGADRDTVISDMEEILLLEILLDNITLSEDRRRDRFQFYHPMSLAQLRVKVPNINWDVLFKALLPPGLHISDKEVIFNIIDLAYFKRLQEVLKKFTKRTLANYHIYYLANNYIRYLAPTLRDLRRSYARRYFNTPTTTLGMARWEECVDETSALLSWRPVSEMYANRNISDNVKSEAALMFDYIRDAAMRMLYRSDWMDNATSLAARDKLNRMALKIPDLKPVGNESVDVANEYEKLNFTNVSYFDAVVQLNSFRNRMTFLSLRQPNSEDEEDNMSSWVDSATPASVNAFYRFDKNEVVLPTAILQYPLFSTQVPRYIQYSRLGTLAGHEIMHGYDDEGRQYDEYGNLRHWWTNATLELFNEKTECLVDQYCNITDHASGHQLNGKRTMGENFADHGGINLAYDAYLWWKKEQKITDEDRLPGLASFSTTQIFFLSFANVWCESIRPEALPLFIDEDEHALGKYRVNVPLQNLPVFAETFNCPLGTPMNPVNKCQLW